eukprot:5393307-Amphidinium_carterae.1
MSSGARARGSASTYAFEEYESNTCRPFEVWGESDTESSGDDEEQLRPDEAQRVLVEFLLEEERKGSMTAKQVGLICFYCSKAGLENCAPLAQPPSTASGNWKRHL